jgi:hypothetical protein
MIDATSAANRRASATPTARMSVRHRLILAAVVIIGLAEAASGATGSLGNEAAIQTPNISGAQTAWCW